MTIEILTEQSNDLRFALQMEGDNYDVFFTIVGEGVDYRLRAVQESNEWVVVVPESLKLTAGEYQFSIDVVMENHIYPAAESTLTVKAPIKAAATIVEGRKPTKTPKGPKVSFVGGSKPTNLQERLAGKK